MCRHAAVAPRSQGKLAVLDVGRASPLDKLLLHEGTRALRTLYEEDFGAGVADVLLLHQPRRRRRRLAAEARRQRVALAGGADASEVFRHELASMRDSVFISY